MARTFDRFMVDVGIGTNRKVRRLPIAERWVYVAGVLSLAAQSPIRGALLIADGEPVTADDIAKEATVHLKHAQSAIESLQRLGMLHRDRDGVFWVHDWDKVNPEPKPSDSPEATRERKRKQRAAAREQEQCAPADAPESRVTPPDSHAPEVEGGRRSNPLDPPQAGDTDYAELRRRSMAPWKPSSDRKRDHEQWRQDMAVWVDTYFPGCNLSAMCDLVSWACSRGVEPYAGELRDFAASYENFAHVLEPAA